MTTTMKTTTQKPRYRMVPLAALERAQGELQAVYQQLAAAQQELEKLRPPQQPAITELSPDDMCVCGHTRGWHVVKNGIQNGACQFPAEIGKECQCQSFFPKDKTGEKA